MKGKVLIFNLSNLLIFFFFCMNAGGADLLRQPATDKSETDGPAALFVEIVCELDDEAFSERGLSHPEYTEMSGYILRRGKGLPVLYPAMGREWKDKKEDTLWIGYRIINLVAKDHREYRTLITVDKNDYVLETVKGATAEDLIYGLGQFSVLHVPLSIDLKMDEEGRLELKTEEQELQVNEAETKTVYEKEQAYTHEELASAMVEHAEKAGVDKGDINLEKLVRRIGLTFPEKKELTFYVRVSAVNHGEFRLADYDVASEWKKAGEKLLEGPYEEAKTALENVLRVLPENRDALSRWDRVLTLLDQKVKPCRIEGTLAFPAGMPDEKLRRVWKKYHEGIASIARPNAPEGTSMASVPVRDGKFAILAPGGPYRLTVAVPGFEVFTTNITLKGTEKIEVKLHSN